MKSSIYSGCSCGSKALIIPSSIENLSCSDSVLKVHSLLSKLPAGCTVRYEMVAEYKPSFTVFSPDYGLCFLDVKDWNCKSLHPTPEGNFRIIYDSGKSVICSNPHLKNVHQIKRLSGYMQSRSIPLNYVLIFPEISRTMFNILGMKNSLDVDRVIFMEDLSSSKNFLNTFNSMFPPLEHPLSDDQMSSMEEILLPDLKMRTIANPFANSSLCVSRPGEKLKHELYRLSSEQEQGAKSLCPGTKLMHGAPGTGKTAMMLYGAKLLEANNPTFKILILCHNSEHVHELKKMYEVINIPARGNVYIMSSEDLIKTLISKHKIKFCVNHKSKYAQIIDALKENSKIQYDAVFIDEAQDFEKGLIYLIYNYLVKPHDSVKNFVIADDNLQNKYKIPFTGKPILLEKVYRSSIKIGQFANLFRYGKATGTFASAGEGYTELVECKDSDDQIRWLITYLNELSLKGISLGNVLVQYKGAGEEAFPLRNLLEKMRQEEIQYNWAEGNKNIPSVIEWESAAVKIAKTVSVKGMDAPVVIIVGAENYVSKSECTEKDINLMYTALTRAKGKLIILYSGKGEMQDCLINAYSKYEKYIVQDNRSIAS